MKPFRWRFALLLLLAFAVRLAGAWLLQSKLDGRFCLGDSESYWRLGAAIAAGTPYGYGPQHARVFRTPGYPLLLAPVVRLAGTGSAGVAWARVEAALLGTLAVAAVAWIAGRLFGRPTAWIAALLAAFYPGAIALSVLVLSEAPFCPLVLLQLGLWMAAWMSPHGSRRAGLAFGAGLAAGAAALMRPDWLLFTPLATVVSLFVSRRSSAREGSGFRVQGSGRAAEIHHSSFIIHHSPIAIACWMLSGLILIMLPWWVRNARLTGRFVPTTLQVGASLYDGLNPQATGASDLERFVRRFSDEEIARGHRPDDPRASFERSLDRRMRDAALAWAGANPGRAAELAGVKFLRMWNVWPNEPRLSASWPARLAVLFTYTPLLIFAIMGAWRTAGRGWPYVLCWLPAVYLTMLHVVFVSSLRYREPAMLALIALAAGELGHRLGRWRRAGGR